MPPVWHNATKATAASGTRELVLVVSTPIAKKNARLFIGTEGVCSSLVKPELKEMLAPHTAPALVTAVRLTAQWLLVVPVIATILAIAMRRLWRPDIVEARKRSISGLRRARER